MFTNDGLVAKVSDGIWIGNATCNPLFMQANNISAVIKLDRNVIVGPDFDHFSYALPDTELMVEEFPKTIAKLDSMCEIISEMRAVGRNIIIQCADGKNKSALVAGYYLTRRVGQKRDTVVTQLSTVYFTPEQIAEDRIERDRLQKIKNGEEVPPLTIEELQKQGARRAAQAMSNLSFRKIILSA